MEPSRGERGLSEGLPPCALDPYASARDRVDGWESRPKPFKAELFCLFFLFVRCIFFTLKMRNTLSFFRFIFSIPIGKTAPTIFPFCSKVRGDANSPLLSLHVHVNWRHFCMLKLLLSQTVSQPYSALWPASLYEIFWGSSKHHPD